MVDRYFFRQNKNLLQKLSLTRLAPFDLLNHRDKREKLVDLVLNESPSLADYESNVLFGELRQNLIDTGVDDIKVVVFGGGTGLSNIIGGDCRQKGWSRRPFDGLKQVFPQTTAVVCVTDDGGSTGELLKDIPLAAIGDIRHVLLSSIQLERLQKRYELTASEALLVADSLSALFNYRFQGVPDSIESLYVDASAKIGQLPGQMKAFIDKALEFWLNDPLYCRTMERSQCLGNLIVMAVICRAVPTGLLREDPLSAVKKHGDEIYQCLSDCAIVLGANEDAVLPSTLTPAQLRFLYTDGVQVSGEKKSSDAQRGFPVDRVFVDFCDEPFVSQRVLDRIQTADVLIMAPGSLYSSIIPVMQVPGIAEAVRANKHALKLLIGNLWVQEGETDKSISDPERKFHVSDMVRAYDRNLPGGTRGLFDQILCLSLRDVPASLIQNYAVEGKVPIYLDRDVMKAQGFEPIECGFFSKSAMHERQVIQHDPHVVAQTVKTLFLVDGLLEKDIRPQGGNANLVSQNDHSTKRRTWLPSMKYHAVRQRLDDIPVYLAGDSDDGLNEARVRAWLTEIIWAHQDIPVSHLEFVSAITCVDKENWHRDQRWDNVFSYYDPIDGHIKIRRDRFKVQRNLEIAFLIAVGEALLGDYAAEKRIEDLLDSGKRVGRIFHLLVREKGARNCYFNDDQLTEFLLLSRMVEMDRCHFTRVVNGEEGFTPPGLLMGLMYAWYLDNRFASHIEYKMSITKIRQTDLIPEQIKMKTRRERLITFFREAVFGNAYQLDQQPESRHLESSC